MLTRLKELRDQLLRQKIGEAKEVTRRDIVLEALNLINKWESGSLCVVVVGNPLDGLEFVGPFASEHDASDFVPMRGEDSWVAPLLAPSKK